MAKFYGKVGYACQEEIRPGVWAPANITEKTYYGDVRNNFRHQDNQDKVSDDFTISDEISILADPFAIKNFSNIRYVTYMGVKWKVNSVKIAYPRIKLTLGGVYNGPESDGCSSCKNIENN